MRARTKQKPLFNDLLNQLEMLMFVIFAKTKARDRRFRRFLATQGRRDA